MGALIYTDIVNRLVAYLIANSLSENQIDILISSFDEDLKVEYGESEVSRVIDLFKRTTNELRKIKGI